jgi:hypothetical protein
MTDRETLLMCAAGALALWWLVKHPEAAKVIGVVLLCGLVATPAATREQRHHRKGYGRGRHHRRYRPRRHASRQFLKQ